jgi:hypothetical protein
LGGGALKEGVRNVESAQEQPQEEMGKEENEAYGFHGTMVKFTNQRRCRK